jgi:hypothetical protein
VVEAPLAVTVAGAAAIEISVSGYAPIQPSTKVPPSQIAEAPTVSTGVSAVTAVEHVGALTTLSSLPP